MDSIRQQKVARLIQKELAEIFQKEMRTVFGKAFITVTQTRVTPDLALARIYLSLFMVNDKPAFMEQIREETKEIRKKLSARIGKQTRIIPNLEFFEDDSMDYYEKIDNLLKKK